MKNGFKYFVAILLAAGVVVSMWVVYLIIMQDKPGRGEFGDMFGALNTLFSGLVLVAAGFAVYFQSRELADARRHLSNAASAQVEVAKLQKQLLELQLDYVIVNLNLKATEVVTAAKQNGFRTPKWIIKDLQERMSKWDKERDAADQSI